MLPLNIIRIKLAKIYALIGPSEAIKKVRVKLTPGLWSDQSTPLKTTIKLFHDLLKTCLKLLQNYRVFVNER